MKLRQAQEFAARGHFAMRAHRKEAAPAAAGRDVAHEPPGPRRHQPQQQVGEVADDQLFARLLGQLIGPVQGLEEKVGQLRLIRHQIPAAQLGAPHRVEQGVAYPRAWRKSTSSGRCRTFSLVTVVMRFRPG